MGRENDRLVRNPKDKLLFPQQFTWLNVMYGWIDSHAYRNQKNPRIINSLQAISDSLSYIQQDAWDEFAVIQDSTGILPKVIKGAAIPDENIGRSVLVISVANMANRLDDLTETSIKALSNSRIRFNGEMFNKTVEKGKVADGVNGRITFTDMLGHIDVLYKLLGLSSENKTFNSIIQAQKKSLNILNRWTKDGEMYSIEEAIESRENTIGAYYGVLARAATSDPLVQSEIEKEFRKCQLEDDVLDVGEDRLTQINPFVSALYHAGLLDEYIQKKNDTLVMSSYNISLNPASLDSVRDQIEDNWINNFLLNHPAAFEQYTRIYNQMTGNDSRSDDTI